MHALFSVFSMAWKCITLPFTLVDESLKKEHARIKEFRAWDNSGYQFTYINFDALDPSASYAEEKAFYETMTQTFTREGAKGPMSSLFLSQGLDSYTFRLSFANKTVLEGWAWGYDNLDYVSSTTKDILFDATGHDMDFSFKKRKAGSGALKPKPYVSKRKRKTSISNDDFS